MNKILRYHVTGAVERGESEAVEEIPAGPQFGCDVAEHFYGEIERSDRGVLDGAETDDRFDCYVFTVTDQERKRFGIHWSEAFLFVETGVPAPSVTAQAFRP